ncbi:putative uncharacterized protein [Alistipes sp. CAG:831]|nr:putative uncharacterized protein [Alistipes sp. CAG:831]
MDKQQQRSGNGCVIWTRVSTKYQEENGGSLDYQKSLCEEYAKSNALNIKGYYGGRHESAKTPGSMVKEMINCVKKDKGIRYIIVSEYDRFSRNSAQAISILNDLTACGVIVVAAKTGQDTRDKNVFLMASIALSLSQWDNTNRVDKFISGRRNCLLKGVWVEKAPLGYYKEGKSKNTVCRLNDIGMLIRQAFIWKLDGCANSDILDRLRTRGLELSKQTLHKVLTNPFYAGKVQHKLIDNQMVDGVHESAITYAQFLEVQEIMSGRTGKYKHKHDIPEGPLKRHVLCDCDGTPLTFYLKKKNGKEYGYYKCNQHGCHTNVSALTMHDKYASMLSGYDLPPVMKDVVEKVVRQLLQEGNKDVEDSQTLLKRHLSEVERQIREAKVKVATGQIDSEIFSVAIQELEERRGKILLELEKCKNNLSNSGSEVDEIVAICCKLSNLWQGADLETRVKLQNLLFPNGIFWNHEKRDYRTPEKNAVFDIIGKISDSYKMKTEAENPASVPLCGQGDSNPHALRHQILSLAWLPITTRPQS